METNRSSQVFEAHPKLCLILASVWMKSPARKS